MRAQSYASDVDFIVSLSTYRPVDLARAVGVSAQTVRGYERFGFLPEAARGPTGRRLYTVRHLAALETARTLIAAYGWGNALEVMRAVHAGDTGAALALVDARHAELDRERRRAAETLEALRPLAERAGDDGRRPAATGVPRGVGRRPRESRGLRVGEAARLVGVRVSALRFWEQQGLLSPVRDPSSRYRLYDLEQLTRLRVIVLLRAGGYGVDTIEDVLAELGASRPDGALAAVERRREELTARSLRCVEAAGALWGYLREG